jgi:N-ethylmaleimide reductase
MHEPLFTPLTAGALELRNRIVMAPMTRNRAGANDAPTDMNAEYYAQRATAGLIVTEGVQPTADGQAYPGVPGLESPEQVEGWRLVADAVHAEGGTIVAQLMHSGRISHEKTIGRKPICPSPVTPAGEVMTPEGQLPFEEPHEATTEEVEQLVQGYVRAAINAREAGLDGVELHGANGYLIAQFGATNTNHRTDRYGGDATGRATFLREVAEQTAAAIGAGRVGLRLSPANGFNDINDAEPREGLLAALKVAQDVGLAYVHVVEPGDGADFSAIDDTRANYSGTLIASNGFENAWSYDDLDELITGGRADAVAIGRRFLANPDLPARIAAEAELNEGDQTTFYGGGPEGYTDYPALAEATN